MADSILNPDADVLLEGNTSVMVKQLTWKKALKFFEMLRGQVKGLVDEKGALALDANKVMDAVQGNAELLEWLAKECTGKDEAWIETLTLGDMAKVSSKAIELNLLAIAAEIKNVRSRLLALATTGTEQPGKSSATPLTSAT
jgi:hypothetical protein